MRENKVMAVLMAVCTAAAILTVSIAVPLLCRPFYYVQIEPLDLAERSGMTKGQIMASFDEVMDYCIGKTEEFSAGTLIWSKDGAAHFADVRKLFVLDLWIAAVSCGVLAVLWHCCRRRGIRPYRFRGHRPGFWAASGTGAALLAVGGLAALDFDRAFAVFHMVFFPGKDNWIFDYRTDPVILILPQEFFRNCAILILGAVIAWCVFLMGADLRHGRGRSENWEQEAQ